MKCLKTNAGFKIAIVQIHLCRNNNKKIHTIFVRRSWGLNLKNNIGRKAHPTSLTRCHSVVEVHHDPKKYCTTNLCTIFSERLLLIFFALSLLTFAFFVPGFPGRGVTESSNICVTPKTPRTSGALDVLYWSVCIKCFPSTDQQSLRSVNRVVRNSYGVFGQSPRYFHNSFSQSKLAVLHCNFPRWFDGGNE